MSSHAFSNYLPKGIGLWDAGQMGGYDNIVYFSGTLFVESGHVRNAIIALIYLH